MCLHNNIVFSEHSNRKTDKINNVIYYAPLQKELASRDIQLKHTWWVTLDTSNQTPVISPSTTVPYFGDEMANF